MIEQIIRVTQDLYGVTPVVHMVQGDTGRTLKCVVADYAFTGAETVSLMCLRPDKTVYRYDGTVDTSDNSANFDLNVAGGALTQAGVVAAQVITVLNGAIVASFAINVIVHEVVGGEATEEDITFLMQLQEQLNEWIADAQTDVDGIIADAQELIEEMVESMDEHFIPVAVTWAEYQALPDDKYTNGKIYFITDRGAEVDASTVPYDHTTSGLTATNVQDAIDEIEGRELFVQDIPSKNLLPNTATTQTLSGITFTVNDDGSITANGTATAQAYLTVGSISNLGQVILSGCPEGGGDTTYFLTTRTTSYTQQYDYGTGVTINNTVAEQVQIIIRSGVTVSNLVFRPMIRLASIEDDTYVPYAKTNVELTKTDAALGEITESPSLPSGEVSIPIGTVTTVTTITVPKGTYVLTGAIIFPADSTGTYRNCSIKHIDNTHYSASQTPPCGGGVSTRLSTSWIQTFSNSATIKLTAEHNASTALTIKTAVLRAVRIK